MFSLHKSLRKKYDLLTVLMRTYDHITIIIGFMTNTYVRDYIVYVCAYI